MSAKEVERKFGGIQWYASGHNGKGQQSKIPWPYLIDR